MHEPDQHVSPIKNWKQLVVVVVLAFAVPIALAVIISQWVTSGTKGATADDGAIITRIQPVGQVLLVAPVGPKGQLTGSQVYSQVCKNCHETGLLNAPKFNDKAAWAKVIAQAQAVTVDHAIKGLRSMPAKGGNPDLENVEVERGVAFMANSGGANWKEPPVQTAKPGDRTGQQVVEMVCSKCHATGVNGAPRIGDRDQWRGRVKAGYNLVLDSALKGHAGMPARGGMAELSDVEVGRAVEYMMNRGAGKIMITQPAPPPVATVAAATATPATAVAPAGAAAAKPDGKKIYDTTCMVCHGTGVAGAPKFGDKAAWAPRIKTGIDALYKSALGGKNAMPAKGGNNALTDAEVKAGVDYMVAAGR